MLSFARAASRTLIVLATLSVVSAAAAAIAPNPEKDPDPKTVCANSQLSRDRYLASAFADAGISDFALDTTGTETITTAIRAEAMNEDSFCQVHGHCDKGTADNLFDLRAKVARFLTRVAGGKSAPAFSAAPSHFPDMWSTLDAFLAGSFVVSCQAPAPTNSQVAAGGAAKSPGIVLEVRATPDDLAQSDPSAFKGLTPASIGYDRNKVAKTDTYSVTGVVGFSLGDLLSDRSHAFLDVFPFVSLNLKSVNTTPAKTGTIDNLGAGLVTFYLFPTGDHFYNVFKFYPLYTRSLYDRSETFTGQMSYYPEPFAKYLDQYTDVFGIGAYSLQPVLTASYLRVLSAGTNAGLAGSPDFFRAGPGADFHFYGAPQTILTQFTVTASYRYLHSFTTTAKDIANFTGSISFAPYASQNVSLALKYTAGRDLQSLQKQNDLVLGLGLKI